MNKEKITMKSKNPVIAATLNLVIPGLGCAYLGNFFYAIVFFVWVPLAYLASFFASGFITTFVQDLSIKNIAFAVIEILLCIRILYEQVSMPYEMAKEQNQRIAEFK